MNRLNEFPASRGAADADPAAPLLERLQSAWRRRPPECAAPVSPRPHPPLSLLHRVCGFPRRAAEFVESGRARGPALHKARELLPLFLGGDALVILHGDHGRGKTCLAAWLAAERLKRLPECRERPERAGLYVKFLRLHTALKDSWKPGGETESRVLRPFRAAAFLVLDECHVRPGGEHDGRVLASLIDERYDARLATVLILNRRAEELEGELGRGVLDRANETGGTVECAWGSYR